LFAQLRELHERASLLPSDDVLLHVWLPLPIYAVLQSVLLPPICAPLRVYALRLILLVQQHALVRVQLFISQLLPQLLIHVDDGYARPLLRLLIIRYESVLFLDLPYLTN
jgi:hypothetical protein